LWPVVISVVLATVGCAEIAGPGSPTPTVSPAPAGSSPSPGLPKIVPALKLDVLEAVGGRLAYCDPDQFPISHGSPLENAQARLPTIRADRATFDAILAHEGFPDTETFTPDQLIVISDDYKQIQAIELTPADDGFSFSVLALENGSRGDVVRVNGTVTRSGHVSIERRAAGTMPECPICLAAGVLIATPDGQIPVQDIRPGMAVWTTDRHGGPVVGVVRATGHVNTPFGHQVVRLSLADGRTVLVSPGHSTAEGGTVGDLRAGDGYDGSVVASASLIPYAGATWDLVPSGPTGTYFANGVLLRSSMVPSTPRVPIARVERSRGPTQGPAHEPYAGLSVDASSAAPST
jgi:hypothetical protein